METEMTADRKEPPACPPLPCVAGCGRPSLMPASEYCAECAAETNATAPVPHSDEPEEPPGEGQLSDAECDAIAREVYEGMFGYKRQAAYSNFDRALIRAGQSRNWGRAATRTEE